MNSSAALSMILSVALIALGTMFALHERRVAALLGTIPESFRRFAISRTRRRLRVAALFIFVGLLTACGQWTDPRENPIRFLIIWGLATIFSLALLAYGIADVLASRAQLRESFRRRRMRETADAERHVGSSRAESDDGEKP
jgi:hypothetical protein